LVVPRPEKKILGFDSRGKRPGHVVVSVDVIGFSLVVAVGLGRSRRAYAYTEEKEECERSWLRMLEPYYR
jgi:hypothetical protein